MRACRFGTIATVRGWVKHGIILIRQATWSTRFILWAVFAVFLFKATYLFILCLALCEWGNLKGEGFRLAAMQWPRGDEPVFASHFATWDGAHYLYLSEVGYSSGAISNAFYPLYPFLVRWTSMLTGGNHLIAGLVVSNMCTLAGWVLFVKVAGNRFGQRTALSAAALMMVFPGSLFYQFVYTESLFFLLLMLVWLGLEQRWYRWVWTGAILLPLCRAVGVFVVLPIAWHLAVFRPLERIRRIGFRTMQPGISTWTGNSTPSRALQYGTLLAPLAGWLIYMVFMWKWTGSATEGFEAQRHWGVHSVWNLVDVPKFVVELLNPTTWHAFQGSVVDRCFFLVLIGLLPVIWRLGKDLVVWTYVLGVLPAMSGTFTSFTRYESTVFPLFLALATVLDKKQGIYAFPAVILLSAVGHLFLLWQFVHFQWAG